ncbi:MAG: hypothetical protein ABSH36_16260 [Solirubrobacteraceae bacterium]
MSSEAGATRIERYGSHPQQIAPQPVRERRRHQQADAERGAPRERANRMAQRWVLARGEPEQQDVGGAHDGVCAGKQQRLGAERSGDAQRAHQQRGHRGEDHQPHRPLLRVDDRREPGIADPRPPQYREHQQPLRDPQPGRVLDDQRGAACEREHEHEVEEQLQRRHPLALARDGAHARGLPLGGGAHRAIMPSARCPTCAVNGDPARGTLSYT